MIKTIIILLTIGVLFSTAYAYIPYGTEILDIQIKHYDKVALKQNEFSIHIKSCNEVKPTCYHNNALGNVPLTVDINKMTEGNGLEYVETIYTNTDKYGRSNLAISMDHKYEYGNQYHVFISGDKDYEIVKFWLLEKRY